MFPTSSDLGFHALIAFFRSSHAYYFKHDVVQNFYPDLFLFEEKIFHLISC